MTVSAGQVYSLVPGPLTNSSQRDVVSIYAAQSLSPGQIPIAEESVRSL
jgi:hypothetical protein